jgi:hypothetical protein
MHMKNKCLLQLMRSAFFFPPGLCSEVHVKYKRRGIKLNIFYVGEVSFHVCDVSNLHWRWGNAKITKLSIFIGGELQNYLSM